MAELKEDKLIIKNNNIVQKGAKDGWQLIKTIWVFLEMNYHSSYPTGEQFRES